jgi:Holliday junction resolvase RusA-like endonuclease
VIPGRPTGKERPRFGKGRVYTPSTTKTYENTVAIYAKVAMRGRTILKGPVQLTISCSFAGKDRGWHINKPDLDNCAKSVIDGMAGVVFDNDCRLSRLILSKNNDLKDEVNVLVQPLQETKVSP